MTDEVKTREEELQANTTIVQGLSSGLTAFVVSEFEGVRPDFVLLAVLDTAFKVVRLFNPKGSTVECCDSVIEVMKQIRDGEAKAIPCNQTGCGKMADGWYVWPTDGERKFSCFLHMQKAIEVAYTLGFMVKANRLFPATVTDTESMGG